MRKPRLLTSLVGMRSAIVMVAVNGSQGVFGRHPPINIEVNTMRDCGSISKKQPGLSLIPPSGPRMNV